jgi:DNA-binding beta-propeller fold protein YncE
MLHVYGYRESAMQQIQKLPTGQRKIVFYLIMIGGIVALVIITLWLIFGAINSQDNRTSVALGEGITVREYAQLPDNDSYPASVAAGTGVVLTGSYVTGAIWSMDNQGVIRELPGTRNAIGAVSGLAVAPDGTLYIVDQIDADPRTGGGDVKRLGRDGEITTFAEIPDERGFVAPDDVTVDSEGNVYISDRGRDEVWRFDPAGNGVLWWHSLTLEGATEYAPTGLAYDAATDTILITDSSLNIVYRVSMDGANTEILYQHGDRPNPPVFDGITAAPDGTIYVAALSQDGIARLDGDELTYIAGLFRGPSDVVYDPLNGRLYVTNFDSGALVVPGLSPRLPFTIDEVTLAG